MKNKYAAAIAAVLVSALIAGTAYAGETQAPEDVSAQEEASQEAAAPAETEIDAPVPETRPSYTASDYVQISDEGYKGISFSVYPPADDSPEAQAEYQTTVDTLIMTRLFAQYPVEAYPEELLNYVAGSLIASYKQYAEMYGMDFSSFLQTYLQMDESTFRSQVQTAAQQTLTEELILKAIAEKEGITVSDEEYEQGCADYAVRYGYDSPESLKQAFDEPTIRISLLMDKTFDYLESVSDIQLIIETETETETEAGTEAETEAAPSRQ